MKFEWINDQAQWRLGVHLILRVCVCLYVLWTSGNVLPLLRTKVMIGQYDETAISLLAPPSHFTIWSYHCIIFTTQSKQFQLPIYFDGSYSSYTTTVFNHSNPSLHLISQSFFYFCCLFSVKSYCYNSHAAHANLGMQPHPDFLLQLISIHREL